MYLCCMAVKDSCWLVDHALIHDDQTPISRSSHQDGFIHLTPRNVIQTIFPCITVDLSEPWVTSDLFVEY